MKPGSSIRPPSSTTSVPGPIRALACASVPTATITPSRTATAWAHDRAASTW